MGYIQELRAIIGNKRILLPGCCVFIKNAQGQILMQQRKHPYGVWGLPGGLMELGESTEEAILREAKEETGLTLGKLKLFGVYSGEGYQCTAANGDEFDVVITAYVTDEYMGEVAVMDDESLCFEWRGVDNLPENIARTHSKIIEDYKNRVSAGTLFRGIKIRFDCKDGKQYQDIGNYWHYMRENYPHYPLKGVGFNWYNDSFDYIIGDFNALVFDMNNINKAYPNAEYSELLLPDKNWEFYSGKTEKLSELYAEIYKNGALDYEIEEFSPNGDCTISVCRIEATRQPGLNHLTSA